MQSETDQAVIERFVLSLKQRYQSLESCETTTPVNRRQTLRRPCGVIIEIAFTEDADELNDVRFYSVQCRDLSSTGFSFWCEQPPPVDQFFVRFRLEGEEILVQARTVHVTRTPKNSPYQLVIGCALTQRLERRRTHCSIHSPTL